MVMESVCPLTPVSSRFRIVRCIGTGGMGRVYEAEDLLQSRRVALKTVRKQEAGFLFRLKNEFRSLQDIEHPNLIQLHDLFEESGQLFFTMELIEGKNFLEYVRREAVDPLADPDRASLEELSTQDGARAPGYDEARLRAALDQLVCGLLALHATGMVHRDLRPANILVDPGGRVVVLDFGLVASLSPSEEAANPHVVGTPQYMAPEQEHGASALTPASDWYSVGVMLYEALTGNRPFQRDLFELLGRKEMGGPVRPSALVRGVAPDLESLCLDLLGREPRERPTGQEIQRRLRWTEERGPEDADVRFPPQVGPTFVGRSRELALLREASEESVRGHPVTVLIEGESGVGKSALMRRFLAEQERDTKTVVILRGRCYERESLPYKAIDEIVEALCQYLSSLPRADVLALLPRDVALLAEVFPALQRIEPIQRALAMCPAKEGSIQTQRTRLFLAFQELLGRLTDRHQLILTVDDLHWTDADSLLLLGEVLRAKAAPPVLLLATFCTGRETAHGAKLLSGEARLGPDVRRLVLERLSTEEAKELAISLAGSAPDCKDQALGLAREADGHPLFLHELMNHALSPGFSGQATLRYEDVLLRRIEALAEAPRRALELLAVARGPIPIQIMMRAAEIEPSEFFRWLTLFRSSKLVYATGSRGADTVQLFHSRIQDILIAKQGDALRLACHRHLAQALEGEASDDLEQLARHWEAALEPEKAAGYAHQAAVRAEAALAFDHAAELYQKVLALRRLDPDSATKLRLQLADTLANAGRAPEAAQCYLAVASLAKAEVAHEARLRAAEQLLQSGHQTQGFAVIQEALAAVGLKIPRTPRQILRSAILAYLRLRLRGLRFREREAREVPPLLLRRIDTYWSIAGSLQLTNNLLGGTCTERMLLLALKAGEPRRLFRSILPMAALESMLELSPEKRIRHLFALAEELSAKIQEPWTQGWLIYFEGLISYQRGDFLVAASLLERSEALLLEHGVGSFYLLDTNRLTLLCALYSLGQLREVATRAASYYQEALRRGDVLFANLLACYPIGLATLAIDGIEEYCRLFAEASRLYSTESICFQSMFANAAQASLDLYRGEGKAAYRRHMESQVMFEKEGLLGISMARIESLCFQGRCVLFLLGEQSGRDGPMERELSKIASRLLRERPSWSHGLARLILAGRAHLVGDKSEALKQLELSIQLFERTSMALYAAVARHRQGELQGGEAGKAKKEAARAWMATQEIKDPDRLLNLLAPGLRANSPG